MTDKKIFLKFSHKEKTTHEFGCIKNKETNEVKIYDYTTGKIYDMPKQIKSDYLNGDYEQIDFIDKEIK